MPLSKTLFFVERPLEEYTKKKEDDESMDPSPYDGSKKDYTKVMHTTYLRAYQDFSKARPRDAKGLLEFCKSMLGLGVSPYNYEHSSCPFCFFMDLGDESDLLDEHREYVDFSARAFRSNMTLLPSAVDDLSSVKDVVMMIDYALLYEVGGHDPLSVMNISLLFDRRTQRSFDFASRSKHDWPFLSAAFELFIPMFKAIGIPKEAKIWLWAESCLKTYSILQVVGNFHKATGNEVVFRNFPYYHGHSRCDPSFGAGNFQSRKGYPCGGLVPPTQILEILRTFGRSSIVNSPQGIAKSFDYEDDWENVREWKRHASNGLFAFDQFEFGGPECGTDRILCISDLEESQRAILPVPIREADMSLDPLSTSLPVPETPTAAPSASATQSGGRGKGKGGRGKRGGVPKPLPSFNTPRAFNNLVVNMNRDFAYIATEEPVDEEFWMDS